MFICKETKWYIFVLTDLIIILSGFVVFFWIRLQKYLTKWISVKRNASHDKEHGLINEELRDMVKRRPEIFGNCEWTNSMRLSSSKLISAQNVSGKILLSLACLCTLAMLGTYIGEITKRPFQIEMCGIDYKTTCSFLLDVTCNSFFILYFILRYLASDNKLQFWMSIYSVVDLLTIPPYFVEIYLDRFWLGLRFLRVLWLMKIPNLLQYLNVIRSATKFRLIEISVMFLCIWISGSGMIHLLENSRSSSEFSNHTNSNDLLTLGDCLYFTMVTMSTVGYGDISPKTTLGRIGISVFILLSFGIFASFIPEVAEIIFSGSKYRTDYILKDEYKHVVVCGNLQFSSVKSFLADFFNEDRPISKIDVVFIHQNEPDFQFKNLLKKNFMKVKYIKGTVMDQADLKMAAIEEADACFIIANHNCRNPKDEDASNIMRVISLKNFSPNLRILVQILQYENKSYLTNIPSWSQKNGDMIFCFSEIENKILAKSCLIPGYSTFIINLLSIRSDKQSQKFRQPRESWINEYINGVGMELYTVTLSSSLIEKSIKDLVPFCYKYLQLLLIAVEVKLETGIRVFISPTSTVNVRKDAVGFVVCKSFKEAQRAALYCAFCHGTSAETWIKVGKYRCKCPKLSESVQSRKNKSVKLKKFAQQHFHYNAYAKADTEISGFYKTSYRDFDSCLIKNPEEPINFTNHIIVCIVGDDDASSSSSSSSFSSPGIDLKHFMLPLRSKSLKEKEIRPIVLAGNERILFREWQSLAFYSDIHPVTFHSINRKSLQMLQVEHCHVCLILSGKTLSNFDSENFDLHLVDKEIILTTLNVKSIFKNAKKESFADGKKKFIISKLVVEDNAQFLDPDDKDEPNCPVFLTEIFACGHVFTTQMLDCLLGIAYFNPGIMNFLYNMTFGEVYCLEKDMEADDDSTETRNVKCHIKSVSLMDNAFQECFIDRNSCMYSDLFEYGFKHHQLICLGIYRMIEKDSKCLPLSSSSSSKKVIITNPRPDFNVHYNDDVLALHSNKIRSSLLLQDEVNLDL